VKFITVCYECEGRGEYQIYNAYDMEEIRMISCEVCEGTGYLNMSPEDLKSRTDAFKN
jgi:DnaJ-class molecular chaperone